MKSSRDNLAGRNGRSLPEDAEIQSFIKEEAKGTMLRWIVSAGGTGSTKVVVSGSDFEKALEIDEEYEKKMKDNQGIALS